MQSVREQVNETASERSVCRDGPDVEPAGLRHRSWESRPSGALGKSTHRPGGRSRLASESEDPSTCVKGLGAGWAGRPSQVSEFYSKSSGQALRGLHSEFHDGIYEFKTALWDLNTNIRVCSDSQGCVRAGGCFASVLVTERMGWETDFLLNIILYFMIFEICDFILSIQNKKEGWW